MRFYRGDIVICKVEVGRNRRPNQKGKIIDIITNDELNVLVEFDNYIEGHRGRCSHCWWVDGKDLKLVKRYKKVIKPYNIAVFCERNYK